MLLREMMHGGGPNTEAVYRKLARPKTAATTSKKDEDRIKKKMMVLEYIERKIEEDLEEFNNKKSAKPKEKGIRITKKMLLEAV